MLKKYYCMIILICYSTVLSKNGITYNHNSGRLGDCLLNYAKHLYLAHIYDLNLYVIPFDYSNHFMIHETEQTINGSITNSYKHVRQVKSDTQVSASTNQNDDQHDTLFISSYYVTIDNIEVLDLYQHHIYKKSIEDPVFGNRLRAAFQLKQMIPVDLPNNMPSVAVHIRRGGGFDRPLLSVQYPTEQLPEFDLHAYSGAYFADKGYPFKFPPEQYYVDQIKFLHTYLNEQPLYVHVFTDDQNPEEIVKRLQAAINRENISFDYRREHNAHNRNVVEDICAMSQFDYLIRSCSHFPWIAQVIGNHKAIVYPKTVEWQSNFMRVTESEMVFPDKENNQLTIKTLSCDDTTTNSIQS